MSLPQIKRPPYTLRLDRDLHRDDYDQFPRSHRHRDSYSRPAQQRETILLHISSLTKRVNEMESRIVEKIRTQTESPVRNPLNLSARNKDQVLPHPIILATLMNAFYGGDKKKKKVKLVHKYRESIASNQNKEERHIQRPSFQIFDLPRSIVQPKNPPPVPANVKDSNDLSKRFGNWPNDRPKKLSTFNVNQGVVIESEERQPKNRKITGFDIGPTSLKRLDILSPVNAPPENSENKLNEKTIEEKEEEDEEEIPQKSRASTYQVVSPQFASKEFSKTLDTFPPNPRSSTFVKIKSLWWKKLRSAFRFLTNLKLTYQQRLSARKKNCEAFYTENYKFVIESIVSFLKKPVHDAINGLLDIKRNFDIVSEIQTSRITFQTLNILKVGSKGRSQNRY
jgi:hypothetical protein